VPPLPDVVQWAVPFFVAAMLLELWLGRRGGARYETRDTLTSLVMGGGNLAVGLLFAAPIGWWASTVAAWAPFPLAERAWGWHPLVFALCFILDDLRYYAYHRAAHEVRWLWANHVTHHSSQHYNLSTALRQPWAFEITLGFLFRLPMLLLGFHPAMLALVGGLNLVYQFWIHTELVGRLPAWVEAVFNTPSHHRVHHATNPRYLDANYAGTLIVWDRIFGTFVPERADDPPRYGLVHQLATFNPLRVGFHELYAVLRDQAQGGLGWRDRLVLAFGPPGARPGGGGSTSADQKRAWVLRHPEDAGQPGLPARAAGGAGGVPVGAGPAPPTNP